MKMHLIEKLALKKEMPADDNNHYNSTSNSK